MFDKKSNMQILLSLVAKKINPLVFSKRFYRQFKIEKLYKLGWYDNDTSHLPAVFIGGARRSGTTLLREMLNRHSRFVSGPEVGFFAFPLFDIKTLSAYYGLDVRTIKRKMKESRNRVRFVEHFYEEFRKQERKGRWIDKTPANVLAIGTILHCFPAGKFIHIIRDGRDVTCSFKEKPFKKIKRGAVVPSQQYSLKESAQEWVNYVSAGVVYKNHPRCFTMRYEKLVENPEKELREICIFLGEPFEKKMLDYTHFEHRKWAPFARISSPAASGPVYDCAVGRWKKDMSFEERRVFVSIAGELLIALGYDLNHGWIHHQ